MKKIQKKNPWGKVIAATLFAGLFTANIFLFVKKESSHYSLGIPVASAEAYDSEDGEWSSSAGSSTEGGSEMGCYTQRSLVCQSGGVTVPLAGAVTVNLGERLVCTFTYVYGAPYGCTYTTCADQDKEFRRKCVQPAS